MASRFNIKTRYAYKIDRIEKLKLCPRRWLKGVTKLYLMHYSRVVIILFSTGLYKSAFSISLNYLVFIKNQHRMVLEGNRKETNRSIILYWLFIIFLCVLKQYWLFSKHQGISLHLSKIGR